MEIGFATRDITPAPGVPLWGYSNRSGPATGTLDPLHAKAIVFADANAAAALVVMDLGRPPMEASLDRIRARVEALGVKFVYFSATHTHHAPVMEFDDRDYALAIEQHIGDVIEEALRVKSPATLSVARSSFDIGHNRRVITEDMRCEMMWRNAERKPTSPIDREAILIKIESTDGKLLGTLVHHACHPVIMGPSNLQYSADYVGELTRIVEGHTSAPCAFVQGGCGDINPYLDKTAIDDGAVAAMRGVGAECAERVIVVLDDAKPLKARADTVSWSRKMVQVGTRWDFSKPDQRDIFLAAHGGPNGMYAQRLSSADANLAVPLNILLINNALAFVGIPGEMFTQHQVELKATSPIALTLPCGYVESFYAYFPTIRDAVAGGYGGARATLVGMGAGDTMVHEAKLELARLIGKLDPPCTPETFVLVDAPGQPPQ